MIEYRESLDYESLLNDIGDTSLSDVRDALNPLIRHLSAYDGLRMKLHKTGGVFRELGRLSDILSSNVTANSKWGDFTINLANRQTLNDFCRSFHGISIRCTVRKLYTGMPVYYLCRIKKSFWSQYGLIIEDYHRSPGYPITDDRIVPIMNDGHETYFLRVSHFRIDVIKKLYPGREITPERVDEILYLVGSYIYEACWHDDQRPGVAVSKHFQLPVFKNTIELLYLCLNGELSELRRIISDELLEFFKKVDKQQAIHTFLQKLKMIEGKKLDRLPSTALNLYIRLTTAFNRFLQTDIVWGVRKIRIPLYKLVFGNFSRLDLVARCIKNKKDIKEASEKLEAEAHAISQIILSL